MLKKIFLILIYLNASSLIFSQEESNNLIIFSEDSSNFYLYINDVRQNEFPHYNIKVTDLNKNINSIILIIKDGTDQKIEKRIYFEKMNIESSARLIKVDNIYKLRYIGEVNMGLAAIDSNQLIISFHQESFDEKVFSDTTDYQETLQLNRSNIDYLSLNDSSDINTITYNGNKGCDNPISSITSTLTIIDEKLFSDQKFKIAKKFISENCLRSADLKLIIKKFEYEDHKLELAKYAFSNTFDIDNYEIIIQLLDFKSSKDKLKDFIKQ